MRNVMNCTTLTPGIPANKTVSILVICALWALLLGMMCGEAGAVEYGTGSGIDDINSGNYSTWSTLLSNNDSTVTCDINVNSGALNLINATIRMKNEYSINVESGATMNVTSGSNLTHDSGYYYFNYKEGSRGNLNDSTVEYSKELNIQTSNNITINNCTIRNNDDYGIHLTSTSGYVNITDCTIANTVSHHGIFIEFSQNNILRNNNLNNNNEDYSLYVTGNYDQDIDTTNKVNGGTVYYQYNKNGTITDTNIGHVTIVDCNNLSFTNCMIHNGDGVRIRGASSNVSISGSTIENNAMYGINFESTNWNNITSVTIGNNSKGGIHSVGTSSYNRIINNSVIDNAGTGIYLEGSGYNNITDNNVSENTGDGICIGSYDAQPSDNTIRNNTILLNSGTGVTFYSDNNDLSENTISENSNLALQFVNQHYNNYIWRNNTANGKEVNYYYNEQDTIIESKYLSTYNVSNVGKITLIGCTNITVKDSELSNNIKSGYGIFLWNSDNNDLTNNTISNNYYGIRLHASSSNNIIDLDTINPSERYGAQFESNSDYNTITDSSFVGTTANGMLISSSSHTTITDTTISSTNVSGVYVSGSCTSFTNVMITSTNANGLGTSGDHTTLTNVTIISSGDGVDTSGDHTTITESEITAGGRGVDCSTANHTDILNTTITAGTDGIYMSQSHWGDLTNNTIDATEKGIFLTTAKDHNLTANTITNYTSIGILLEEYSTNTTMIGNDLTRNGAEFDIRINDSNDAAIANNELTAANYTFYLTGDTRLCTLDTVFNKTKVGYEDTSNLTLMWRIDVLCWDNYHQQALTANLTVQYSDLSDANGLLCWEGEISAEAGEGQQSGRLSGNLFDYWGPPTSSWLPVIEYKQNVSGKTTYQPMNCTAINYWDVLQDENTTKTYRNVTTTITEPGVTICVDTGYTPNSKCYYCHVDKLTFANTKHWTRYETNVTDTSAPYTPGRCIDCHDETDSEDIPHGNASGKDLLYFQSPQLCYTGRTDETACHSVDATDLFDQEREFNQTTHHPLGDGQLACKSCHDNHGTDYESDLLKHYEIATSGGYNSDYYALCLVCHLEEKIVAKMSGEIGHLANYMNKTNFRDEYYWVDGFGDGTPKFQNIHSPQSESGYDPHYSYNCYSCHNPHGSGYPATTRPSIKYTYITNLTPPSEADNDGDWADQTILDHANWSNSTMNQAGGLDNPSCGGCHGFQLKKHFNYREFIDYEPAGGAGCLECHDNNASAYNTDPIRPIVNLTAIKLAMHTNLSGSFRTGSDLKGTNKNFTEWLTYRGYTDTNITEDNAICWACHSTNGTPPSPGFHPDRTMTPYKCPKCHGPIDGQPPHTEGLVAAIDNHGPTTKGAESILIQTDVGSGGSCGDCHAPSVLPNDSIDNPYTTDDDLEVWKYTKKNNKHWRPYEGRTVMGDVSHYGLNKTQGGAEAFNITNPLCNTTDCLFCHCNWTNGQIWGNATNISGNMYGADTTNLSTCYSYCHVRPTWVGTGNNSTLNESTLSHFHNESIYAGGGPNCVLCHDVESDYGVQSLVNTTAIAEGIHGNILNNTLVHDGYNMDDRSNPCWGCHNSDGTIPEGMGDRNGVDLDDSTVIEADELPYTCEDCHARSAVWNSATSDGDTWKGASDPDLGLNRLPPVISDHYPNAVFLKTNVNYGRCVDCHNNSIDPDANDTEYKELGHTIFSNISHYGTTGELVTPTNKCRYCHNDTTTNVTLYGNAPQNQHGNFADEADPNNGCYYCHANNQTPVDFHNMNALSIKGDPNCLKCHDSNGMAARRRINETVYEGAMHARMNYATSPNSTNQSCWVCHFPEGLGMDEHNNRREPAYNCYECHNKVGGPFSNVSDAPKVHNHFLNGTSIQAYWEEPTDLDSCLGCHNHSEMIYPFIENDTYRTNFSIISHYGNNQTDLVNKYNESNTGDYCGYCHKNKTSTFCLYYNWITHQNTNCQNSDCHGPGRLHNSTLTRPQTDSNCTYCHADYGEGKAGQRYIHNVSAINLGVHANVNSNMTQIAIDYTNDVNNAKCWGCHVPKGAYPANGHKDTFNNDAYLCDDCHNGTSAYDNVSSATIVYNHFKNGDNISACTTADTISDSCVKCHNLTGMKVPGFDVNLSAYRTGLSQASHYTRNRTDIVTDNISDCTWCHRNSSNEFIEIFERPNDTAYISHATDLNSCILEDCHRSGRIHDSNLIIPSFEWGAECKNCHFGLTDSIYYVNETMFDASVHGTVNCIDCHINESSSHPVEEYYWKWCECCHSYQTDPTNESDRHNVTNTPSTYSVEGTNVLDITDCTTCHNATAYNATVDYYTTIDTTNECRYCHAYPDKGNRASQEWY